ncbi:hypothetical protein [Mucilaginibacter sp. UR6-1]|nr:hypothetical protein [Mucilaginibacter sp. UR6-1]
MIKDKGEIFSLLQVQTQKAPHRLTGTALFILQTKYLQAIANTYAN